jgi:hypothetical protein
MKFAVHSKVQAAMGAVFSSLSFGLTAFVSDHNESYNHF